MNDVLQIIAATSYNESSNEFCLRSFTISLGYTVTLETGKSVLTLEGLISPFHSEFPGEKKLLLV